MHWNLYSMVDNLSLIENWCEIIGMVLEKLQFFKVIIHQTNADIVSWSALTSIRTDSLLCTYIADSENLHEIIVSYMAAVQ